MKLLKRAGSILVVAGFQLHSAACSRSDEAFNRQAEGGRRGKAESSQSERPDGRLPRRVDVGIARGFVVSDELLGSGSRVPWVPNDSQIEEFERGLQRELKQREEEFELTERRFPRKYSGIVWRGQRRLQVEFCYPVPGWEESQVASSNSPCKLLMHYDPKSRRYLGPVKRDEVDSATLMRLD